MRRSFFIALVFIFAATLGAQENGIDYEELNAKIFSHLEYLNEKGKSDRKLGGALMIGLGAAAGIGGYLLASAPSSDQEYAQVMGYTLLGIGAVYAGIGVPVLLIPSKEESTFEKFRSIPDGNSKIKVEKGERLFRDLADDRRSTRLVSYGIILASGVSSILLLEPTTGAIWAGLGLAGLVIETKAEKEWKIYKEDKLFLMSQAF